MSTSTDSVLRTVGSIGDFTAAEWATLAGTSKGAGGTYNPFLSHAFLSALEESGSATDDTGWYPQHLRLESAEGELLGAAAAIHCSTANRMRWRVLASPSTLSASCIKARELSR